MTDPISDMLNRIINAQRVSHPLVEIPFSNLKYEIANVLEKNGFVEKIEKKGKKTKKTIEITLKYDARESTGSEAIRGLPVISGVKMISKPGQRIYIDFTKIRKVRGGFGISIISTSKGLMSDREARKNKIGGELICEIW